jgi:hypothetical protein
MGEMACSIADDFVCVWPIERLVPPHGLAHRRYSTYSGWQVHGPTLVLTLALYPCAR